MDHARTFKNMDYRSIVVADDHAAIRNLLKLYFKDKFRVLEASSGAEAYQLVIDYKPFVALLDVMMDGDMDGIQTLKRIKTNPLTRDVSVALVTAKSQSADQQMGKTMGADAYFVKPFSLDKIHHWVEKARTGQGHSALL